MQELDCARSVFPLRMEYCLCPYLPLIWLCLLPLSEQSRKLEGRGEVRLPILGIYCFNLELLHDLEHTCGTPLWRHTTFSCARKPVDHRAAVSR